jgi:SP family sugar:H+ symporter-like MFS transporter
MGTPLLKGIYKVDDSEYSRLIGNINLYFALGACTSVLLAGPAAEKFGRVKMLKITDLLIFLTYYCFTVESLELLQFARYLCGFACGLSNTIGQLYIKEIMPKRLVGIGGMITYTMMVVLVSIDFSLGVVFSQESLIKYWKYFMVIPLPISLLRFLIILFIKDETPKYYFSKLEIEKARELSLEVLKKFYVEEDAYRVLEVEHTCFIDDQKAKPTFRAMLKPKYINRLRAAIIINIGNQLSGISFFSSFSTDLFNKISHNGPVMTFGMGLVKIVAGFIGTYAIKKYGRRQLFSLGVFTQMLCFIALYLLIETEYFDFLFPAVAIYIVAQAIGIGGLFMVYTADILPPKGIGMSLALNWICSSILGKLTPLVLKK